MSEEKSILIVSSKVKEYIKSKELMTSSDVVEGLNEKVYRLLDEAMERTKSNKRSTVRASDF